MNELKGKACGVKRGGGLHIDRGEIRGKGRKFRDKFCKNTKYLLNEYIHKIIENRIFSEKKY